MPVANDAATDPDQSSRARNKQVRSLSILLRDEFGVTFRFYDAATGGMLTPGLDEGQGRGNGVNHSYGHGSDEAWGASPMTYLAPAPNVEGPMVVRQLAEGEKGPRVRPIVGGRYQVILPFPNSERPETIAVSVLGGLARTPDEIALEQSRLVKWCRCIHQRLCAAIVAEGRHRHRHRSPGRDGTPDQDRSPGRPASDGSNGSTPLGPAVIGLEALLELERLMRTMKIDQQTVRGRRQVLLAGATVVRARGVIWVPPAADSGEALAEGESLVSPWDGRRLVRSLIEKSPNLRDGMVIDNHVHSSRFPLVTSLLAVPVPIKGATSWLIALNKSQTSTMKLPDLSAPSSSAGEPGSNSAEAMGAIAVAAGSSATEQPRFRRTDAALLLPFAGLLGLNFRATRRQHRLHQVMVGLTRSLAAAIDARDTLVAGHSERVARIAVELGASSDSRRTSSTTSISVGCFTISARSVFANRPRASATHPISSSPPTCASTSRSGLSSCTICGRSRIFCPPCSTTTNVMTARAIPAVSRARRSRCRPAFWRWPRASTR